MKRLSDDALRKLIRQLRRTGVTRDSKRRVRGRTSRQVQVGDIIMSKQFAYGYRRDGVTVVGADPDRPQTRVVFNPVRARSSYIVESIDGIENEAAAGQEQDQPDAGGRRIRARRLNRTGTYDPDGEVIEFCQHPDRPDGGIDTVTVIGQMKKEVALRSAST